MRAFGRFLFTFNGALWLFTLFAALALLGYPLARNLYAAYTWEKIPCWYAPATKTWYFDRDGSRYSTDVPDFWSGLTVPAAPIISTPINRPFDDTCYVSRSKPYEAVHSLAAHKNWEGAMPRIIIVIVIVGVAIFLGRAANKKRPRPLAP